MRPGWGVFLFCTTDILSVVRPVARDKADNRIRHSEH